MEKLIGDMMVWEYLNYVRRHPVKWEAPTEILCGSRDQLTSYKTTAAFTGPRFLR